MNERNPHDPCFNQIYENLGIEKEILNTIRRYTKIKENPAVAEGTMVIDLADIKSEGSYNRGKRYKSER